MVTGNSRYKQIVTFTKTHLNFNWKIVGPFNIDDIFQNELILDRERKRLSPDII